MLACQLIHFPPFCSLFVLFSCWFFAPVYTSSPAGFPFAWGCDFCLQICTQHWALLCATAAFKAERTSLQRDSAFCKQLHLWLVFFPLSSLSGFLFLCDTQRCAQHSAFPARQRCFGLFIKLLSVVLLGLRSWNSETAEGSSLLARHCVRWCLCSFCNRLICFKEDQPAKGSLTECCVC